MGTGRILVAALLALAAAVAAQAQQMRIEFAEPVEIFAAPGTTQFEAYGRRFTLTLEKNSRLLKSLPARRKAELERAQPLRGKIEGNANSWVRLTQVGSGLEGAIWDGTDLYVIARYGSIAANLAAPLNASASQTIVYRLSDTVNGLPEAFCGLGPLQEWAKSSSHSALKQYQGLVSELRMNAAGIPSDQLDISLIADTAFQNQFGGNASDAMLSRLNIVDGIFAEQVGVIIAPTEFRLVPAGSDPFVATDPAILLEQLSQYRQATPAVSAAGIAHLMTGKDLDGNTLGIAYVDALCDAEHGVSLSDSEEGGYFSALVMAHELGHNFGAHHDGVAGGGCEATPQSYLMAPNLNSSAQFSQCSLDKIASVIANARGSCLGAARYADLTPEMPASPFIVDTLGTFALPITVHSIGNATAQNATLRVALQGSLTLQSATVSGGGCTASGNIVTCTLGDIAAAENRPVVLNLSSSVIGSYLVTAATSASNDYLASNDTTQAVVGLQSAVDLGVAVSVSTTDAYVNDLVEFYVDVSAHRSQPAHGGTLTVQIGNVPIESISAGPHACSIDSLANYALSCNLADIAPGSTSRITVRGRPAQSGYSTVRAQVNLRDDGDYYNNNASKDVSIKAEREIRTVGSIDYLPAVLGVSYDITYTVTGLGRLPSNNAVFEVSELFDGVVESVAPGAGTCGAVGNGFSCPIGTLNPGEVRTFVVRMHMVTQGVSSLGARTVYDADTFRTTAPAFLNIYANFAVDVVAYGSGAAQPVEVGATGAQYIGLESRGIDPAQNVVATIELPLPLLLKNLVLDSGPAGWTCEVLTSQRGRCMGSLASAGGRAAFHVNFSSDTPVDAVAKLTVDAPSDGDLSNNAVDLPLRVLPFVDVAVTAAAQVKQLTVGQPENLEFSLTTAANPVQGVRIVPFGFFQDFTLESLDVAGKTCTRSPQQMDCFLGDLAGNSILTVTLRVRALSGSAGTTLGIQVDTARDSNPNNNHASFAVSAIQNTDIALSVAQSTLTGVNGSSLRFPLVTVQNGAATSANVSVEIPLPPFATVGTVSSSAICSGTATLQCTFASLGPNAAGTIDISLLTNATGTFTSNLTLRADNDSTPANNTGSVVITVTAPSNGGGSSGVGGGGGGGGRLDWFALSLLGLLLIQRHRRSAPGRRMDPD